MGTAETYHVGIFGCSRRAQGRVVLRGQRERSRAGCGDGPKWIAPNGIEARGRDARAEQLAAANDQCCSCVAGMLITVRSDSGSRRWRLQLYVGEHRRACATFWTQRFAAVAEERAAEAEVRAATEAAEEAAVAKAEQAKVEDASRKAEVAAEMVAQEKAVRAARSQALASIAATCGKTKDKNPWAGVLHRRRVSSM